MWASLAEKWEQLVHDLEELQHRKAAKGRLPPPPT